MAQNQGYVDDWTDKRIDNLLVDWTTPTTTRIPTGATQWRFQFVKVIQINMLILNFIG